MPQTPAGIGFDVDHTLLIDNKLERVAFLHLLDFVVSDGGHPLGNLADESARIDALLAEQRSGAFPIDEAVARFVRARGVEPRAEYGERFRAMALRMAPDFVVPLPGARQTLEALGARGIAVAVLSNGWNPLQAVKGELAGFSGHVIASGELGLRKPDRRAFEALLERLGTSPERTWYVGDDPRVDVAGSAAAGLVSVWIDADGTPYPRDVAPPAMRIGALDELLALAADPVALS